MRQTWILVRCFEVPLSCLKTLSSHLTHARYFSFDAGGSWLRKSFSINESVTSPL